MAQVISDLETFLYDPQWDAPLFKKLAKNDSGEAHSNQGGPALPKALLPYLPPIEAATADAGSKERNLDCELFDGRDPIGKAIARYHFQDWAGTRTPEYRITRLQRLASLSKAGDVVILQRRVGTADSYRVTLLRDGTDWFERFSALGTNRPWGLVWPDRAPLSEASIQEARKELVSLVRLPFVVQKDSIPRQESKQLRIARTVAFKEEVRKQYNGTCAISGIDLRTPLGLIEVQAAHVVPLSSHGMDDVRNGLAMCSTLHWAFDRGLFGIEPVKRTVWMPRVVLNSPHNQHLREFSGRTIAETKDEHFRLHDDALAWHMENLAKKWDDWK